MTSRRVFMLSALAGLSACSMPGTPIPLDGGTRPQRYDFPDAATVMFRMLDGVNSLRSARGLRALQYSAELNAAAVTHSRDMAIQDRPWHFGSDGSSPFERVRRVGYRGELIGEAIAETFDTELETLTSWMQDPGTRSVILDPNASEMGFGWVQQASGRIWWTMVIGRGAGGAAAA